jgi:FkbM family methyltransferase
MKRTLQLFLPLPVKRYLKNRTAGSHQELTSGEKDFFHLVKGFVSTVVDVGARTDTFYSEVLEEAEKECSIYLFEANPVFVRRLKEKIQDFSQSNIVVDHAVGSKVGELFYYFDTQSFIASSNVGTVSKLKSKKPIPVTTLDLYFGNTKSVDFLKTDIEEMDFHALLGARELLKKIKFLQFELGIGAMVDDQIVSNETYWALLEDEFHLFILKDTNPIWQRWPHLPLLLRLDIHTKLILEVLQKTGAGFNIVGVRKGIDLDYLFKGEYSSIHEQKLKDL